VPFGYIGSRIRPTNDSRNLQGFSDFHFGREQCPTVLRLRNLLRIKVPGNQFLEFAATCLHFLSFDLEPFDHLERDKLGFRQVGNKLGMVDGNFLTQPFELWIFAQCAFCPFLGFPTLPVAFGLNLFFQIGDDLAHVFILSLMSAHEASSS
jgi:hypothetical protein